METTYACYPQLPGLLGLRRPRTADDRSAQWAEEHSFVTVHQSAESPAGQALVDLGRAAQRTRSGRGRETATVLRRVAAVIGLLGEYLAPMDHLTPDSFARIDVWDCLPAPATAPGTTPGVSEADERGPADELRALRTAVIQWCTRHVLLVERMIGDRVGTGGTSGLAYPGAQIDLPPHTTHD